jgi:peptidoglycan DL-endopeptidase CwlS
MQVPGLPYVVVRFDNSYRIARRFGVGLSQLFLANNSASPGALFVGVELIIRSNNPPPPPQLPEAFAYTVLRGDNLFWLLLRFGVRSARIRQLNGLISDIIFVGQTLIIAP